jgi:hypothetical protein
VSEDDLVGGWAHEVGHDIGLFLSPRKFVPHPTPESVQLWDLMARGSWGCGPRTIFGCPTGSPGQSIPTFMSSITRKYLGLLSYDSKTEADAVGSTFWISALETTKFGDKVTKIDLSDDHCYLLEVRNTSSQYSFWDTSVPATGLVLYHVDPHGMSTCGDVTLNPAGGNTLETINVATRLDPPPGSFFSTTSFDDWAHSLRFTAVNTDAATDHYRIQVGVNSLSNPLRIAMVGIVLSGGSAFQRVGSCCAFMPPMELPILPDLDLHAYTEDGRHVGINYATGKFENQIANTEASGDQFNGHEWIVLPASTPRVHFVVSGLKALQFLMEFPQLKSALGAVDDFTLSPVVAAPSGSPTTVGTKVGTIPIGGSLEVPLVVTQNPDGTVAATFGQPGVTINSLIAELNSYCAAGAFKDPGEEDNKEENACNGLRAELMAAKRSIDRGHTKAATNQLKAFQHELNEDAIGTNLVALKRLLADSQELIDGLAETQDRTM